MRSQTRKQNLRQHKPGGETTRMLRYITIFACLISWVHPVQAISTLPKHTSVPGGVAIVSLNLHQELTPQVYYRNQRVTVISNPDGNQEWMAIVGIPLDAKPGSHELAIQTESKSYKQQFMVENKKYREERLTIPNKRKVKPLAEDLPLIEKQYLETIRTYQHWQHRELSALTLPLPVTGRKSSPFGLKRIMNNIPQNPHSGLDIAAIKGTPVYNPKDGTVINTGNFFYSGNIVFIDHGQGFITSYCHLDTILVNKGQELPQGELLGTVGKTGRATGAHLHWSVSLNGVRVDPELFIHG